MKEEKLRKAIMLIVALFPFTLVIGLLANLVVNKKENVIHPTFEVGGLDADGKYVRTDDTLFTPDAIEYNDLNIKLDIKSNVKYQLYFYNENDKLIEKTDVLTKGFEDNSKYGPKRVRILIIPEWDENVKEKDRKVSFFDKGKYIDDLTICASVTDEEFETFTLRINSGNLFTYECIKGMTWEEFFEYNEYINGSDHFSCIVYVDSDNNVGTQGSQIVIAKATDVIEDKLYYDETDNLSEISFQINMAGERTYQDCIDGMTWEEWVNSSFNTENYIVENGKVVHGTYHQIVDDANGNDVNSTDLIISSKDYTSHS